MKTHLFVVVLLSSTLTAITASAQPAPFNESGVTMGHWHIVSKDVEANKKLFLALGGKLFMPGGNPLMMFPGLYINLVLGTEKADGGTEGSVINHVGFTVNNVQERVAQWKAAGVAVLPGINNRVDQAFVVTSDGVRIEILEDKTQSVAIRGEHVHLSLPESEIPRAQAWYARTFGGKTGVRNDAPVVDIPAVQIRFARADAKQAGTRGRVLDHIGFDVKDHRAAVKKIEAQGITLDEPVRKSAAGNTITYITDPWGTRIEIVERAPLGPEVLASLGAAGTTVNIATPMPAPEWAQLERRILADSVPAAKAFFAKYYDERGYFRHVVRWGANDGPDDAFENTAGWPELHALGASDEILQLHLKAWEGMLRQFTEAKTTDVPIGRQGMYYKDFSVQSDWMHHGEALRTFNVLALSAPALPAYQKRARTYAALYMGEDPDAPNYDPQRRIIKSMINGSRGPMLRKATSLDWVGDPFDVSKFVALHGEDSYEQFLAHYQEYTDVVGDHFLNLVATTLPLNAYLVDNEPKYKRWLVEYMDAWLARMKQNGGVIPSYVALDGTIGGPDGKWWNNAYGWGFSPVNPVTGKREDRNRIPRATVGFANALLVTGDQKYADAWRAMIDAVNSHARTVDGRTEYPTMRGDSGWSGWQTRPWNVGALELWYWSMKPEDRPRIGRQPWVEYLQGRNPDFPETALKRDLDSIPRRIAAMQKDPTTPETRLADNAMEFNPAAVNGMVQLMWGALVPGREGSVLSARLRYFDPVRRRAGVPDDVGALVSELRDDRTVVTLVNVSRTTSRTVVVQGGGYGEHQILSADVNGRTTPINARDFTVQLAPGAGAKLTLAMKRYANPPTAKFPWDR